MNRRVRFDAEVETADGGGGSTRSWTSIATVWGEYMPERGRERIEAGHLEASNVGILNVRYSSLLAAMVLSSSRVMIDGVAHQIRSIINPDQRKHRLEMVVERGVAPHG
jgi:SPP1 family predicted phage head-tail adaptor